MVLVGYWPLNETEGDTAYDYSGNENHGSVEGSEQAVEGVLGSNAYYFDDSNEEYISIPDNDILNITVGNFTLTAWVKLNPDSNSRLLTNRDEQSYFDWALRGSQEYDQDNDMHFHIGDSDNSVSLDSDPGFILDNDWHHVVVIVTRGGGITKVSHFKDGSFHSEASTSNIINPTETGQDILIGNYSKSNAGDAALDGRIQDIRVYNRALSASEVQYLYSVGRRGCFVSRKKQP